MLCESIRYAQVGPGPVTPKYSAFSDPSTCPHLFTSDTISGYVGVRHEVYNGQYIEENKIVAHRESPLTLLVHYADYWTAHIYEDDKMRKKVTEEDYWSDIQNKGERMLG